MEFVVDTNVLVIANGRSKDLSEGVSETCVNSCVKHLREIMKNGKIHIDWTPGNNPSEILEEYKRNNLNPQLVGYEFIQWIYSNSGFSEKCGRHKITKLDVDPYYSEFPNDKALEKFDLSDRKFVATANVAKCPISCASDRGWNLHKDALSKNGIEIKILEDASFSPHH